MSDDRVASIDALVAAGEHPSRASVIVAAIDRLVEELERARIDREIIDGYSRIPPTDEEMRWAEESARRSIADEPW